MSQLVSVIMPAFNADRYISDAIESVLKQSHFAWELLIVNDGSTDQTGAAIKEFQDERIIYFEQENQGVGAARNLALKNMTGDYFCFLDADDVYPTNSLETRLKVFARNPNLDFVDGTVQYVDDNLKPLNKCYTPSYTGDPFPMLLRLDERCLFGNTWMIKRDTNAKYSFETDMSHAEDLFFYLTISCGKNYDFTLETILYYRQNMNSAMRNIGGLQKGYLMLFKKVQSLSGISSKEIRFLRLRLMRIIFLSQLFDAKDLFKAVEGAFKVLRS
ncbi:MAG: glycosyltransferase family 2 protein [Cyclobacteriaceae bacterium]